MAIPLALNFLPWSTLTDAVLADRIWIKLSSSDCQQPGKVWSVEVARTSETRSKGLSRRRVLPAFEGMIFVYPSGSRGSFWMKDTWIPLEIAFFDENGRWITSMAMQVEDDPSNPVRQYALNRPYTIALETNPGEIQGESGVQLCVGVEKDKPQSGHS